MKPLVFTIPTIGAMVLKVPPVVQTKHSTVKLVKGT